MIAQLGNSCAKLAQLRFGLSDGLCAVSISTKKQQQFVQPNEVLCVAHLQPRRAFEQRLDSLRFLRAKLRFELFELIEEGHDCCLPQRGTKQMCYVRRINFAAIQPASTRPDRMSQLLWSPYVTPG